MPNIEQQLQSVREDVAALVRERDAAWVDSAALKAEVATLKAELDCASSETRYKGALLVDARAEVERLASVITNNAYALRVEVERRDRAVREIERLKASAPPERAIVIDPGENPQADEIVRVAEFLSTSPNHHNSSPAGALRDLACASQLFADVVIEMEKATTPPAPAPDGPCVLKGTLGWPYDCEFRSTHVDMAQAEKHRKLMMYHASRSHLEIVPAEPPKTKTMWRVRWGHHGIGDFGTKEDAAAWALKNLNDVAFTIGIPDA